MISTCVFRPSRVQELKQLTEDLQLEENHLQMFFKLSPDLFCILTQDCKFAKLNDSWDRQLGWSNSECLHQPLTDFVHPDDVTATVKELCSISQGEITRFTNRLKAKVGKYTIYDWSVTVGEDSLIYATARVMA
jgi:PAS domain S-box-containing protein